MSAKLSKIRFFMINLDPVIVPKSFNSDAARKWYEKKTNAEVFSVEVVSLTDKVSREKGAPTWARLIEERDFAPENLPVFL